MAAITTTWDPASPAGSDNIKDGDDSIRTFKVGLTERLRNGGHQWQTAGATTDTTDGRHCCGESNAAGSAELAGEFNIYAADTTTVLATFRDSTAATPSELYLGANKLRTTGNVTAATGTFSGAVSTGALTTTGAIKPATDDLYDLGDATHRYQDAWFSGVVTFSGSVVHNASEQFNAQLIAGALFSMRDASTSNYRNATAASTILGASDRIVLGKITGNSTVTLPTSTGNDGRELWITIATVTVATQKFTIVPNGTDTVIGTTSLELGVQSGNTRGVHLICNGTNWSVLTTYQLT